MLFRSVSAGVAIPRVELKPLFERYVLQRLTANGLTANPLTQNVIEAGAALNGSVIGIELPPVANNMNSPTLRNEATGTAVFAGLCQDNRMARAEGARRLTE